MFDIEPVSLVISMVLIILFSIPFIIFKRKQSKKIKSQKLFLEQLETNYYLKFDQTDDWRDMYFIGMDSARKILVYVKFGTENTIHKIDLDKVTDVKLLKMERPLNVEGKALHVLDSLILKIEIYGEKTATRMLEFYDSELFSDNLGELPLIQKWEKIIKPYIKYRESQIKKNVNL
ncbi:hypothetical protein MMU07_10900 [Aquiflexum sp. LQ15W]|uniref:hypothetical protein n=1 Tax=Cognataquiflexum nitidum TaxID=2922272 RepID=UPI001F131ACB|nr:hypothetical protein [Cognataquiflexum nitidum]MCH6200093.1 hypothetical protein [Cognataquiflexum nitidum]